MTSNEQRIYDLVNSWADGQGADIPDMNRRLLMDMIRQEQRLMLNKFVGSVSPVLYNLIEDDYVGNIKWSDDTFMEELP